MYVATGCDLLYIVTLQRAVSAAIAGRTFSTQAAWWQILGLPICDTNILRDKIFINSRKRRLNLGKTNTDDEKLVAKNYFDAYAQRENTVIYIHWSFSNYTNSCNDFHNLSTAFS